MSSLDPNTWYQLFSSSDDTTTLTAADENGSHSAAVFLGSMGNNMTYQEWRPRLVSTTSDNNPVYTFQSRSLGNTSLLSVYQSPSDGYTYALGTLRNNVTDPPEQSQWLLTPATGRGTDRFFLSNLANSTSWLLNVQGGTIYMDSPGSNTSSIVTWAFISAAAADPIPSATSTASSSTATSSSSSTITSSPSTATTTSSADDTKGSSGGSSLSTGAIVGIAIGSALVLILIAVFAFFFLKRRKRRSAGELENNNVAHPVQEKYSQYQEPEPTHELPGHVHGTGYSAISQNKPYTYTHELDGGSVTTGSSPGKR